METAISPWRTKDGNRNGNMGTWFHPNCHTIGLHWDSLGQPQCSETVFHHNVGNPIRNLQVGIVCPIHFWQTWGRVPPFKAFKLSSLTVWYHEVIVIPSFRGIPKTGIRGGCSHNSWFVAHHCLELVARFVGQNGQFGYKTTWSDSRLLFACVEFRDLPFVTLT